MRTWSWSASTIPTPTPTPTPRPQTCGWHTTLRRTTCWSRSWTSAARASAPSASATARSAKLRSTWWTDGFGDRERRGAYRPLSVIAAAWQSPRFRVARGRQERRVQWVECSAGARSRVSVRALGPDDLLRHVRVGGGDAEEGRGWDERRGG